MNVVSVPCAGAIDKRENRSWSPLVPEHRNGGIVLTYSGGDQCPSSKSTTYSISYRFICAEAYDDVDEVLTFPFAAYPLNSSCEIHVIWPSVQGCPIVSLNTQISGQFGGYSWGWLVLFCLLALSTLYIVGGCVINMVDAGKDIEEAFPHKDFWTGLPALVRDGCSYFVLLLRRIGNPAQHHTYTTYGAASTAPQSAITSSRASPAAGVAAPQAVSYGQGISYQSSPADDRW